MDTILIFQGGGSLGAYECGVYQALAPWLRRNDHHLAVVAGTSIGAINASIITARFRDADQGAGALQNFWKSLSVKSFYFPLLAGENSRWNAVWTSLLFGNPRLFRPTVPFWAFSSPVTWSLFTSFYDVHPMEETLASFFHRIGPRHENPRLIVTAVDLQKIQPVAFDSYEIAVTPRHVVASSSLPPSFPATEIDRRSYWDGGLWSNTPLPEVLRSLRKSSSSDGPQAMTDCLVFIVDLFAPGRGFPPVIQQNYDVWALRDRVLFQDKASYDGRCADWVNECIELVRGMRNRLQSLPPDRLKLVAELDAFINESYRDLYNEKRLHLDIHRIVRSHTESDEISRDIDFSPERINSLINQGRTDTSSVLATIDQHSGDRSSSDTRAGSSSELA